MTSATEQRLLDQTEKLTDTIAAIQVILARQEEHLEHHIKRTDLLEESVEMLRNEIKPIKSHVEFVNKLCKFFTVTVAVAASSVGIIVGLLKLLEALH